MKKYLADTLSFLRFISPLVILILVFQSNWTAALCVLLGGWATDLFDGMAARKYGSYSTHHPTIDIDGIADAALAFGASLIVVGYALFHSSWFTTVIVAGLYILTVVSGIKMVRVLNRASNTRGDRWIIGINMVLFHGVVQIGLVIAWFVYMATHSYVWTVLGLFELGLLACALKEKPTLWLKGRIR